MQKLALGSDADTGLPEQNPHHISTTSISHICIIIPKYIQSTILLTGCSLLFVILQHYYTIKLLQRQRAGRYDHSSQQ